MYNKRYTDSKEFITVREAALALGVAGRTVRRWAAEGKIAAWQMPRRGNKTFYRIFRRAVEQFLGKVAA